MAEIKLDNKVNKNELSPLVDKKYEIKNNILIISPSNKKNILLDYISLIKIIASIFVIIMHTNANYYTFNNYWISTNIMTSIAYCAVPLFSLCIGATLLNYNEKYNIKEYYKRRFKKIVIPIVGWNIIYYFYKRYILKNLKLEKINFIVLYRLYFYNKLNGIIYSLRIFVLGYMIIPLIANVEKKKK
jgi:peptidoglycan/LPS O-acetylase OafA/YrhL